MNFIKFLKTLQLLLLIVFSISAVNGQKSVLNLQGVWRFQTDQKDIGETEKWYNQTLQEEIYLPGSTDEYGFGVRQNIDTDKNGHLTRLHKYVGKAWYQKEVFIDQAMINKNIFLFLERCHWESKLWINDRYIGSSNSLSTPHTYDLTSVLNSGLHTITILIDNTIKMNVGEWPHGTSYNTQTNWNGIIGRIELQARGKVYFDKINVGLLKDLENCKINGFIHNQNGKPLTGNLTISIKDKQHKSNIIKSVQTSFKLPVGKQPIDLILKLPEEVELWDEFSPKLYDVFIQFKADSIIAKSLQTIGFRYFEAVGRQFYLNGRAVFLRGNVNNAEFPVTGYPPVDEASWNQLCQWHKEYGINHIRFHSWCPPEAAFKAADLAGIIFQVELPLWRQVPFQPGEPVLEFAEQEASAILDMYGNHPSFCLFSFGNEHMGGLEPLTETISTLKEGYPVHNILYAAATHNFLLKPQPRDEFFVSQKMRIGQRFSALSSIKKENLGGEVQQFSSSFNDENGTDCDFNHVTNQFDIPLIAHELGQWNTHPDFSEIDDYPGVLKPYNLIEYKNTLVKNNLENKLVDFQKASGIFAWKVYKEDIESILRTYPVGGYQLLSLQDYPGFGAAMIGLADVFYKNKGFISPDEFRKICSETVPLLRMEKFVWYNDESFQAQVEVAHYGNNLLSNQEIFWQIEDDNGIIYKKGNFESINIRQGKPTSIGEISFSLSSIKKASRLKISVGIKNTPYQNDWEIWVYPRKLDPIVNNDIIVSQIFDKQVEKALKSGKNILITVPEEFDGNDYSNIIEGRFLPVFWSFNWYPNPGDRVMGILCDPLHPAFSDFPTDFHNNWQWMELLNQSKAFNLKGQSSGIEPIVYAIDDFSRGEKLGFLFEGKVGDSKILLTGFNLTDNLEKRPVARQLRKSLLDYMESNRFNPQAEVDLDLLLKKRILSKAKIIYTNSESENHEAEKAIDNDLNTYWMTSTDENAPGYPHELQLDLGEMVQITGFVHKPKLGFPRVGNVSDLEVYVSTDGIKWGNPVAGLRRTANNYIHRKMMLDKPIIARYVKFKLLQGFGKDWKWGYFGDYKYAGVAEFDVLIK